MAAMQRWILLLQADRLRSCPFDTLCELQGLDQRGNAMTSSSPPVPRRYAEEFRGGPIYATSGVTTEGLLQAGHKSEFTLPLGKVRFISLSLPVGVVRSLTGGETPLQCLKPPPITGGALGVFQTPKGAGF